jgi:hypothetical protein
MTLPTRDDAAERELSSDQLDAVFGGGNWGGEGGATLRHFPIGGGPISAPHPGKPTLKQF